MEQKEKINLGINKKLEKENKPRNQQQLELFQQYFINPVKYNNIEPWGL